jgi:NAD(P)-dependent dehydrogenase (short-subunit alcohol dehydrogenase family)
VGADETGGHAVADRTAAPDPGWAPRRLTLLTLAGIAPGVHRAGGLGPSAQDGRGARPMRRATRLPSVKTMIALVTGASRGLGRALAAGLAREGYDLIIDARNAGDLDAAAAGIRDAAGGGSAVTAIPGDVTDPAHRDALLGAARAAGRLDLLVNNAGTLDLLVNNAGTLGASPLPALADYPVDELRAAFEVNVIAPVALTQLLLPLLRASGGAVLNITSDAAVEAYAGWGGYGAAKAALEQASNVLAAEELAVRVWWADPGDLRTDMHQRAFPGEDISDRPWPEAVVPAFTRLVGERLPSGRYRAAHLLPVVS